jgi:hypothetical protein
MCEVVRIWHREALDLDVNGAGKAVDQKQIDG